MVASKGYRQLNWIKLLESSYEYLQTPPRSGFSPLLSRHSEVKLAILFGSQAAGSARRDSDIDLALLAGTPISSHLKLELIESIGVEFGRPVDIVDLFYAPEPILGQVLKGRRLLGDNSTYASLLTKHLMNVADFVPLQTRILDERRASWINK